MIVIVNQQFNRRQTLDQCWYVRTASKHKQCSVRTTATIDSGIVLSFQSSMGENPFAQIGCIAKSLDTSWTPIVQDSIVFISKLNTNSIVRHFNVKNFATRLQWGTEKNGVEHSLSVSLSSRKRRAERRMLTDEHCSCQLWHAVEWLIDSYTVSGFVEEDTDESHPDKVRRVHLSISNMESQTMTYRDDSDERLRFRLTFILFNVSPLSLFLCFFSFSSFLIESFSFFEMFDGTARDQERQKEQRSVSSRWRQFLFFVSRHSNRQRCMHSLYWTDAWTIIIPTRTTQSYRRRQSMCLLKH